MSLYRQRRLLPQSPEIVKDLSFSVFTPEEMKKLAVKKIVTPLSFDPLGHPIVGGLYDLALGPMNDRSDPCATCQNLISECPGHMGYIELALPVVNPIFQHLIGYILKMSCLKCSAIQIPVLIKYCLSVQIRLLDYGLIVEASELEDVMFSVAQKSESRESVSFEAEETIKKYEQICKEMDGQNESKKEFQTTKNIEALRRQFLANMSKFINKGRNCLSCKELMVDKIKFQQHRVILCTKSNKPNRSIKENVSQFVNPNESRNYMREIWKRDSDFLLAIAPVLNNVKDREHPTDIFYFEILPVPPPMIRPANVVKGKMSEHPKTNAYRSIMLNNIVLNTIIYVMKQDNEQLGELSAEAKDVYLATKGSSAVEKLSTTWEALQSNVDGILDKETSRQNEFLGLKQILEKKQGLLRMHMMGKRVNYSARSVITPDPNLKIDEIGIPQIFAKQLTYPTYVNPHNIEELRKMVINGPNIHPGANMVEFKSGKIIRLDPKNQVQRESVAKLLMTPDEVRNRDYSEQKVVHRHLCNNDILLLNRQPSLHKPSVMAHKARILEKEKTFRLHYANCKAYNADFDGDEMNAHFPQTERARSEAYTLLNVANQYLVPKDGTPLSGLIQDHVIAGVKLSLRGNFFNEVDYNHLVFQTLYHRTSEIKTLPPTILKPQRLWSGKQVLSTIIMNIIPNGKEPINLHSKSKIKSKDWQSSSNSRPWLAGGTEFEDEFEMSESLIIIRKGELLSGVLDKSQYGATPFGLIHCIYELYGGACSTEMLSALTRLFTSYLQLEGFTLGVLDLITKTSAEKKRRKVMEKLKTVGPDIMRRVLNLPGDTPTDDIADVFFKKQRENPNLSAIVDREYKAILNDFTNKMNKVTMSGLVTEFPQNNLQFMVTSGAKGTPVNTMQISCCLGQIELEGKRPPRMISGRTLPSFPKDNFAPGASGFIPNRFMTGIIPEEFFFHCMAGREGLVDTAVKTSRSGYLQRCLVKSLEGIHVKADGTVRDSDNTVIQFLYGQDGMDICKSQFLSKKHLPFLHENMNAIMDKKIVKAESKTEKFQDVKDFARKLKEWKKENGSPLARKRRQPFTLFTEFYNENSDRKATKDQLIQLWREAGDEVRQSFIDKCRPCPDTLNSQFFPQSHFGSINERLDDLIKNYDGCKTKKEKKDFDNMMKQKAMTSLCDNGEAVGLLAAQSIGEPSTQMTLNTFHFAGTGDMNVTLGIPRLREILMTASKKIKTPSMVVPFLPIENLEQESEALRKKFNRVTIANVLKDFEVEKTSCCKSFSYNYAVKFIFLEHRQYMKNYCVNPKYIIKHMKKKYFKLMFQVIGKQNKHSDLIQFGEHKISEEKNEDGEGEKVDDMPSPENDSSDEEPDDEDDAKTNRKYEAVHDDQEPEDVEMLDDGERFESEDEDMEKTETPKPKVDDADAEFLNKYKMVQDFSYDQDSYLWCQISFSMPFERSNFDLPSILKEVSANSVIWEISNINKSVTYVKDGVMTLRTDGINIPEMSKYDKILDLQKLYCNDIHQMIEHCGLGAGMDAIVKEIQDVFEVYGITIDPRHLMLISEYMTSKGVFEGLNRTGMQSSASPFQQMSFEASLQFLKDSVIGGKVDVLKNPSSSLVVGTLGEIGSAGFEVLQKLV